jgi:hypothetical protein
LRTPTPARFRSPTSRASFARLGPRKGEGEEGRDRVLDRRCEATKSSAGDLPVVPMRRRHVALRISANQRHLPRIPRFSRGAFRDRHGRWARGAMDACSARDECAVKRTAKSCGPDFSTLKSTWRWCFASRRGRWQESPITGESAKEAVNTIAQGVPGCFGEPVVTCLRAFLLCTQGCGCADAPGIPCALGFRGKRYSKSGRIDAAGRWKRVSG